MAARSARSESDAAEPSRDIHADRSSYLVALDELTVPQLNEVIREAGRLKDSKLEAARAEFMSRVKVESEQLGLNLGSLFQDAPKRGRKPGSTQAKGTVAAKYRGPGEKNGAEGAVHPSGSKWQRPRGRAGTSS